MSTSTYELDTLRLLVNVTEGSGISAPVKDLTGATVEAVIEPPASVAFDGGATILNAIAGRIKVEFAPDTFEPLTYSIQIRVTDAGGDTQTVYDDTIVAARSYVVGTAPPGV